MIAEGGGFAASLDADSEGEEGKFYVWSAAEIVEVLGDRRGRSSPRSTTSPRTAISKATTSSIGSKPLLRDAPTRSAWRRCARSSRRAAASRVRPGWDDKVLADWNGLMIAALAKAAARSSGRIGWRPQSAPSLSSAHG